MQDIDLNIGDKVKVLNFETSPPKEIHYGIVIALTTKMAKVYRPKANKDDSLGDVDKEAAEFFPINGKFIKVVKQD